MVAPQPVRVQYLSGVGTQSVLRGPEREGFEGAFLPEETAVIRQVCDMHHHLEQLRSQGLVESLMIEDAQWRPWNIPVRLLAKLLYLILLHDIKDVGSAYYAEKRYSLKLMWGDSFGSYYFEVRDRRQSEDMFQMNTSVQKLLQRISKGLERVYRLAIPMADAMSRPPPPMITPATVAAATAATIGRRRGEIGGDGAGIQGGEEGGGGGGVEGEGAVGAGAGGSGGDAGMDLTASKKVPLSSATSS
jgi:hypothetical protein